MGIEGQVLVMQFVGMDGDGVDIGLAVTDAVCPTVDEQAAVAAHLATDVAEVELILLQVALCQSVGTHVHVEVEARA